jgi:hypothetical protein
MIHVYPQPATPVITQIGDVLFATAGYLTYQWYFGSDSIQGAIGSYYQATQSGNYNLAVTDSNGCVVGVGILNVIASVNSFDISGLQFDVIPNPNKGEFSIVANRMREKVFVEIFSSIGQLVFKTTADFSSADKVHISAPMLSRGIYSLKIISAHHNETVRLVVE